MAVFVERTTHRGTFVRVGPTSFILRTTPAPLEILYVHCDHVPDHVLVEARESLEAGVRVVAVSGFVARTTERDLWLTDVRFVEPV